MSSEPAGAVPEAFTLDMVEGGGLLELRDQEPYEIEQPTTIDGNFDPDTGLLSDATFATPTVSFEFEVETPAATAFIDADFAEVEPASGSGTIDSEGNVLFETAMTVTLHVVVILDGTDFPFIVSDCVLSPVELQFTSAAPYDTSTGRVTLVDEDFSVPAVAVQQSCSAALHGAINDALEGGGHALSLTLEGEIPLPVPPGEPSITTLAVEPQDTAPIGAAVTLTATVAPGDGAEPGLAPTGFVEFRRGPTVMATIPLTDDTAEFETTTLPVGIHSLTARYRGDADFAPSTSDPVSYTIVATPLVTVEAPSSVLIGGEPVEFEVTVTNTGLGSPVANARIDLTFRRTAGNATLTPATGDEPGDRVVMSRLVEGSEPESIALSGAGQARIGSIGEAEGASLAPGESRTERVRLELPDVGVAHPTNCGTTLKTCPGPVSITAEVILVDPDTGEPTPEGAPAASAIASGAAPLTMVETERRATTFVFGAPGHPGIPPFLPPILPIPAIRPHTIRPGATIGVHKNFQGPAVGNLQPTGPIQFLVDDEPSPFARQLHDNSRSQFAFQHSASAGGTRYIVQTPADLSPGEHTVTMRFLGDAVFLPAEGSLTITVEAPPLTAVLYECDQTAPAIYYYRAHLEAVAHLPAVAKAGELDVEQLDLRLLADRGPSATDRNVEGPLGSAWFEGLVAIGPPEDEDTYDNLEFTLGPDGSGGATAVDRTWFEEMPDGEPVDPETNPIDQVLDFQGETGTVTLAGEPGDVVTVTVDGIQVRKPGDSTDVANVPGLTICEPLDNPAVLGEVTIAGTNLSASATSVQPGAAVTFNAEAVPGGPGIMVFSDGATTLDVVPTAAAGTASSTVSNLAIGSHDITAQFFPSTLGIPSTTSDPVTVTVIDPEPAFSDVPEDSPFFDAIQWLAQKGITTGFPDGTFQPAAAISRDAVAAWLWRYAGEPVVDIEQQFSDVPPEHPFYDAIQWMGDVGITTGFPDGTFQPASPIARDAVAAWLWRFAGEPENTLLEPAFSDVPADHPFYEAVQWLAETEITTGFPDGTFQPAAEIERQAVAAWLFRLANL